MENKVSPLKTRSIKINIAYEIVMAILALTILILLALEHLVPLTEEQLKIITLIDITILAIFAMDYFYRFFKAQNKVAFMKSNIFDLIAIIPFDKTFRLARLARLARIVRLSRVSRLSRISRLARLLLFTRRFFSETKKLLKTNGLHYMIAFTILIILIGAVGILHFEQDSGSIHSFGDAVWWSLVTTTTVGYGDVSPSTTGGRILAGTLMIVGIGFIGMVTGSIATFFVDKILNRNSGANTVVDEQTNYIKEKLDSIEDLSHEDVKNLNELIINLWRLKSRRKVT